MDLFRQIICTGIAKNGATLAQNSSRLLLFVQKNQFNSNVFDTPKAIRFNTFLEELNTIMNNFIEGEKID